MLKYEEYIDNMRGYISWLNEMSVNSHNVTAGHAADTCMQMSVIVKSIANIVFNPPRDFKKIADGSWPMESMLKICDILRKGPNNES